MDFQVQYLSFFVIQVEGKGEQADKRYKHYQTMGEEEYENSSLNKGSIFGKPGRGLGFF